MPEEAVIDAPTEALASPEETTEQASVLFDKLLGPDDGTAPPPEPDKGAALPPAAPPKAKTTEPKPVVETAKPEPVKEPTAITDEEVEQKPAGLSQKAGEAWEKKNHTIKALKSEVSTYKTQVQEVEAKYAGYLPPDQAKELQRQLQDYQQKLDSQDNIITKIRHEMHPKYKESIVAPLEQTTAKVKGIAERSNINGADLLNAIADPDGKRLDELLSSMSERDKVAALSAADKYQEIMEVKRQQDEKAKENLTQWEQENQRYDEEQMTRERAARERDIEERIPNVQKRFERYAESDEEKATLKTALDIAKQDRLWEKPASVQAAAAVALAMAPFQLKRIDTLKEENVALRAQLSGYRGSDPANVTQQHTSTATVTDDDDNDTDIVGRIKRAAEPIGSR